jgi:NADPH-dependent 2,4-dienoyl-CoA reductase/sulfur reductase-like enzyme
VAAPEKIVVVGASLAGLRAVENLRRLGFDGRIVWIGAEPHLPYDRPPLSKQILKGTWEPDSERMRLRREPYAELELDMRLGVRATALDADARQVVLDGGVRESYDRLLIATGAAARRMPGQPELEGIHLLRTLDDALAVRSELERGPRVLVVGAGFIGAEVAASCRERGLDVVMIEPQPVPLMRGLGKEMGEVSAQIHRDHGVDLRCGLLVDGVEGTDRVERVRLSDGTAVDADLVVVGIGAYPVTDWLASSGVAIDDGVVCDAYCRSSLPDVYAAGDVARFHNPVFDEVMRIEHWSNAVDQAVQATQNMLADEGAAEPYAHVPWFWSDQYDVKIQFAGRMGAEDEMQVVSGSIEERKFVSIYGRAGRIVGVLTFGRPRAVIQYKKLISAGASWDEALAQS